MAKSIVKNFKKCMMLVIVAVMVLTGFYSAPVSKTEAASAKINKSKKTVYVGKTCKLKITGSTEAFTWKSDNPTVAKVGKKNGKVTGLEAGKAVITATGTKGTVLKSTITVKEPYISPKKGSITVGETLQIKVYGASVLQYGSSDEKYAVVSAYRTGRRCTGSSGHLYCS